MNKEKILESSRRENKKQGFGGDGSNRAGRKYCRTCRRCGLRCSHSYLSYLHKNVLSKSVGCLFQHPYHPHSCKVCQAKEKNRLNPRYSLFGDVPHVFRLFYPAACGGQGMNDELKLKNNLKEARAEKKLSQTQLAEMIGVSRNTISSIETGQFNPTAKLALILCIALDKKFEELFYF